MNKKAGLAAYYVDFYAYLSFVFVIVIFYVFFASQAGNLRIEHVEQSKEVLDHLFTNLGVLTNQWDDRMNLADALSTDKSETDIDTLLNQIVSLTVDGKRCTVGHTTYTQGDIPAEIMATFGPAIKVPYPKETQFTTQTEAFFNLEKAGCA